jgi:hypothetical protein
LIRVPDNGILSTVSNLAGSLEKWSEDLESLRQNQLLAESRFISFAIDRGLPVFGVLKGDPGDFHDRGWLRSDGTDHDSRPLFHPFRIYPLHRILNSCRLGLARSATLRPEAALKLVERLLHSSVVQEIEHDAPFWNEIVDLAILLEPVYWPDITGRLRLGGGATRAALLSDYRNRALELVKTLDPKPWRERHDSLRIEAGRMDENSSVYLLLRASDWDRREELKGHLSGALWIRHIAEVIRRAFEEVYGEQWREDELWLEEDQAFGTWHKGGRRRLFGAERPLDNLHRCRPYLAYTFGVFTGSAVRWYVEGDTEYYAIEEMLGDREGFGIEPVNMHGIIERDRDNIALKLEEWLKEDRAQRRFSMISFDCDRKQSVDTIRRQIKEGNLVGCAAAHQPDFEFQNFTVEELARVAGRIDEACGFSGDPIRNVDWTGIQNGKAFEERYRRISARKPGSLKGQEWGRALAVYARDNPRREDDGSERPLLQEIRMAVLARISDYDREVEHREIDPVTFKVRRRTPAVAKL